MLLSYTIVDFHLFFDEAVDTPLGAPLKRSQCKDSDTQMTVKACEYTMLMTHDTHTCS